MPVITYQSQLVVQSQYGTCLHRVRSVRQMQREGERVLSRCVSRGRTVSGPAGVSLMKWPDAHEQSEKKTMNSHFYRFYCFCFFFFHNIFSKAALTIYIVWSTRSSHEQKLGPTRKKKWTSVFSFFPLRHTIIKFLFFFWSVDESHTVMCVLHTRTLQIVWRISRPYVA